MIEINELRRLAQAATPGPWIAAGPSFGESLPKYLNEVAVDREGDEDDGYSICNTPIGLDEELSADMAFIAAANPATVIELLDRLEAAEKGREQLRSMIQVALVVLDEVCGNINPERGYADELETDGDTPNPLKGMGIPATKFKRAIAAISLYNAKGEEK